MTTTTINNGKSSYRMDGDRLIRTDLVDGEDYPLGYFPSARSVQDALDQYQGEGEAWSAASAAVDAEFPRERGAIIDTRA